MNRNIEITCLNNNQKKNYPIGTSLSEIFEDMAVQLAYPALGARVNNQIEEMSYEIIKPKIVEFFDITNPDGWKMYMRSLMFVLQKAIGDLFEGSHLSIKHSISKGLYCEIEKFDKKIDAAIVSQIKQQMLKIIQADYPFVRKQMLAKKALELFEQKNFTQKALLFKTCPELYTSVYEFDSQIDYYYGYLVPSSGKLTTFDLVSYYDGMLLRLPQRENPQVLGQMIKQDKMYEIFKEHHDWGKILGIQGIGNINESVINDSIDELIKISEALHEKKVAQIADMINSQGEKMKVILVAGPSSSGKTTFSKRLAIQLKVAGLKPVQLSLDDYFVNREDTPKDKDGNYDFECLQALDINYFNENINNLLAGKEVDMPRFSFTEGKRVYSGKKLKIDKKNIIIIEGIHALNPKLTAHIKDDCKFKIYISALTQIGIDGHNRIPTTDNRLIRRIVRDNRYRGYSALDTLRRWQSVRRGEDKYIFPYQEEADVMFNSALLFELGVLKRHAEPLLKDVFEIEPEYSEALRLLKFLSYFKPVPEDEIPPTSILREFLTGSSFKY